MAEQNYYQILGVKASATQTEIKRAYRTLAKQVHPDSQTVMANHDRITAVNAAYEVLKDPAQRRAYDASQHEAMSRFAGPEPNWYQASGARTKVSQEKHRQQTTGRDTEQHLNEWLKWVYRPVNYQLSKILKSLKGEIRSLSADPYDDVLMENFQTYLEDCRTTVEKAQKAFRAYPNPANVASVAATLYYCLNHIEDGVEELERFTYCYDDHYLSTGRELFRISTKLQKEAQTALKHLQ